MQIINICGFGQEIENCFKRNCNYYSTLNSKCNYHLIKASLDNEKRPKKANCKDYQNEEMNKKQPIVRDNEAMRRYIGTWG
jgi:hypothetical protein